MASVFFGGKRQKSQQLTPEQEYMKHQVDELKRLQRAQRNAQIAEGISKVLGKMAPKGKIRHPDSVIINRHLYFPKGMRNLYSIKRIRLF